MAHHCAVIGMPIGHSLSPLIHQTFARQVQLPLDYEKILGDEGSFEQQVSAFFAAKGIGLNVTLPFKQRAFVMASMRSARCQKAGAANTLLVNKEGRLYADNTDGIGFLRDLSRYRTLSAHSRILVLGAGGAARGIIHPLLDMSVQLTVANRGQDALQRVHQTAPQIQTQSLDNLSGTFDVIINATSAGVLGESIAVPEAIMSPLPFCYDLAYQRNKETPFVAYARRLGCPAVDGLGMLVEQAAESFYLWHGVRPEVEPVLESLLK